MDERLVTWARAVKARRRLGPGGDWPVLWLFTDETRLPDPLPAIGRLPVGLCGVVFRHDGAPGRAALAAEIARVCRQRRLVLSIAGDWRLAARWRAWVHLRRGRGQARAGTRCTASAHDWAELRQGLGRGAVVFVSPVFHSESHPGEGSLGVVRWAALAGGRRDVLALGGVDGRSARRLPRVVWGAGAIGALGGTGVKG